MITEMEKKYDFSVVEKEMQKFWEENEVYKYNASAGKDVYSIDTPPPTVSGSLHIGHIFSYTQAEIIARFRRMQGYNVFYPFGFDDNGLPTERLVEREDGIVAKNLLRSEFIQKCVSTTEKYEDEFKNLWKSMGFSCDWSLEYKTISPKVQRISQKSFVELYEMGKAYTKESPVLWCTECQTSIAQAELETAELDSQFVYIPFMCGDTALEVATTRPELLYGVVCLFVNPNDERYKAYVGKKAIVPPYGFEVPILTDEKVGIEKGTGVVMCATYGDSTDVEWCTEYNLPYKKVILPDGTINAEVPLIGGLKVLAARKEIIKQLSDIIIKIEKITHMVATHERCGKDIEIIPSKQWYIDVMSDKERFLKAADEIKWYPEHMKNRYITWVENLKFDWCISRQRYFGVPFPVWYCAECGKPYVAEISMLPVNPFETTPEHTCKCGCTKLKPETAVFDTWATSSLTPQINAANGAPAPMSMRTQAHEIIRTWAFYTIVKSLYHTNQIPWNEIMICGFVLAKKGEKISKSKNNADNSPANLIENHSADVLRYWAANAKLGTDSFFSADELTIARRFVTKLWNASKFAISHLEDYKLSNEPKTILPIDAWMIERVKQTAAEAAEYLFEYEIGSARHVIDDLFWKDFCDNYLEIVKERLYRPDLHGEDERLSGQRALFYSLLNILKMYSIYVPHITDYIYHKFFKNYLDELSIHKLTWDKKKNADEKIIKFGELIKDVVFDMRKFKSENNLSMRAEMDCLEIEASSELLSMIKQTEKDLLACSSAKMITYR